LVLLVGVLCRLVMADRAAYRGTNQAMMMSKMPSRAADYGTFNASFGVSGASRTSKHECQNCACQNRFHTQALPLIECFINPRPALVFPMI
jgi:hypothetical protein